MRARRLVLLALVAIGCAAPEKPQKTAARAERVAVTRELLSAFRDAVYASYDVRLLADPGSFRGERPPEAEVQLAMKAESSARERLVAALEAAGSTEAKKVAAERLPGVLPIVHDALVKTGRYEFIGFDTRDDDVS